MHAIDIEALVRWAFREEHADIRGDADADAQTIYWAVIALPDRHSHLVEQHGRAATRPLVAPTGHVVDLAAYRAAREAQRDWLEALTLLRRVLDGALLRYRPTGPLVAELLEERIAG
jgi:hypothetical protein